MGKPESSYKKKEVAKSPVSKIVVGQYFTYLPSFSLSPASSSSPSHHTPTPSPPLLQAQRIMCTSKRPRPASELTPPKKPGVLIFVVVVPLLLEPLRLLPQAWEYVLNLLASIGLLKR
jgi:hypothetical protein